MNSTQKEISYQTSNTYETLNSLTDKTKNIWFVCHGMGFLTRYFLRYFESLNKEENFIIAPQAPSKYYLPPKMRHVGASWLTKENTQLEMENIIRYFDGLFKQEKLPPQSNFIVLGFSQGVSVALRYLAKREISCDQIIIHSGKIPHELKPLDFEYLPQSTKAFLIYGNQDEYLDAPQIEIEINRAKSLFGDRLEIYPFEGGHEINMNLVSELAGE
ncbi:esterase [Mangrovimonas sp. AS39]|uniref:alpha/beta hydrolase n=1 Tax=Mangrovimonas futianensis TaxID=2895523 RepID=UPI001E3E7275|nr:esterase [Mangrovimonas futianensis]MCF1191543.1 esterase [Mangrovimonas futianensis]MCF1195569.1 esterase [Mangrovimonas futianensis]